MGDIGWDLAKNEGISGTGDNRYFDRDLYEKILRASESWKSQTEGINRAWLCWNVHDDWCWLQQQLIVEAGWTPIVGWDPSCSKCPPLVPGAIAIDFNADLRLPLLWSHLPLEFSFLWTEKLAFWHSDLILSRRKMEKVAKIFSNLTDNEVSAVFSYGGLKNLLQVKNHRYWELLGCTTQGASRDQFEKGAGWFRHIAYHMNAPKDEIEQRRRKDLSSEHGAGILYWKKYYKGQVHSISERWLKEEHFSVISIPNYIKASSKTEEMEINFNLDRIAQKFGISDLLLK